MQRNLIVFLFAMGIWVLFAVCALELAFGCSQPECECTGDCSLEENR